MSMQEELAPTSSSLPSSGDVPDKTFGERCYDSLFFFDTVQFITVEVIPVGVAHRTFQLLALLYIIIYAIWFKQGYLEYDTAQGILFAKTKGIGLYNGSVPYDAIDIVQPPIEPSSLFLTTALVRTLQTRGNCLSSTKCSTPSDCATTSSVGELYPICNTTSTGQGYCLMSGWCPIEDDSHPQSLEKMDNMTIFIRTSVYFPSFRETLSDPVEPVLGRNLFSFSQIVPQSVLNNCTAAGCLIVVSIDWSCNFDKGNCAPTFSFNPTTAGGFNYRSVSYFAFHERELLKLYGVRLLIGITGTGCRFSFFSLIITLGSNIFILSVCTLIVDYVLLFIIYRNNLEYIDKKYDHFLTSADRNTKTEFDNVVPQ